MYTASEIELDKLLGLVLEHNASDLHLTVGDPPVIRVDGALVKMDQFEVLSEDTIAGLVEVMMNPEQKQLLQTQEDVDLSYSFKEDARFRINVYWQKRSLAVAFRLIPTKIKTVKELNLPDQLLKFTEAKQGLVLVVGPTGHGKSTALASMIDHINHERAEKILTIEDPIEFIFTPDKSIVNQREIFIDSPSFAQALKASLREDANVIFVGEMRDLESIATVITLAETGHLVLATLHTNDAAQTIDRILDVFPPYQQPQIRSQLANVLQAVVSMRLLPKIGGGRMPAVEILKSNTAVQSVIRGGKTYDLDNIVQTNLDEGMVSLDRSLASLVKQGLVSFDEAHGYIKDEAYFNSLISKG